MNYDQIIFIYLILFSFTIFLYDINSKEMKKCINNNNNIKIKMFSLLFIHQLLQVFGNFSWLFNNKIIIKIYVITIILYIFFMYFIKNKCFLTELINKICKWNNRTRFNDIFQIIGLKKYDSWNNFYHYIYMLFTIFIAIYKIM